jgi:D-glycero-D-manno-heptose 1,7-bisphosphate phosphatase
VGDRREGEHAHAVNAGRPAVFLDRDGVIAGLVWHDVDNAHESASSPDGIELMPDVAEALKTIGAAGYLTVVVSNQPAAAKRTATRAELAAAHDRLVDLLEAEGVRLDAYRYSIHHYRVESLAEAAVIVTGAQR